MENSVKPESPKPPLTAEQLVDLRARVLRGEEVSDEELKHALNSLAMSRGVAPAPGSGKEPKVAVYQPKGSLADRMAAFKAKSGTDAAGTPQVDAPKPS